jgi:hypothetical protein
MRVEKYPGSRGKHHSRDSAVRISAMCVAPRYHGGHRKPTLVTVKQGSTAEFFLALCPHQSFTNYRERPTIDSKSRPST